MASKIFLDANIILDFTLQRDAGYQVAKDIIQHAIEGKANVYGEAVWQMGVEESSEG